MHIAVIGHMRGGTTLFRQWLGSPDNAFDLGEIFHGLTDRPNNFWEYLFSLASSDAKFRHPVYRSVAWQRYLEEKHRETGADTLVFDLKIGYFNYVLNYDGAAYKVFCLDEKTKIIFLERRNIARMILSRYVAEQTNRWFQLSDSPPVEMLAKFKKTRDVEDERVDCRPKIFVDPVTLGREIGQTNAQSDEIRRVLRGKIDATVVYEHLLSKDGCFDKEITLSLANLMQVREGSLHPKPILAKQSPANPLAGVENAEEIVRFFRGTVYQWMFDGAG
jgi:hypothetical protein